MPFAPVQSRTEIDVTMHWAKWLACIGLAASMTFMAAVCVVSGALLPFATGALALFGALLVAALLPALAALRAGFLVRLDSAGIHGARRKVIAWRDVQAVDVQTRRGADALVVRSNGSEIALPLFFARNDPDLLLQEVRVSSQLWRACHG